MLTRASRRIDLHIDDNRSIIALSYLAPCFISCFVLESIVLYRIKHLPNKFALAILMLDHPYKLLPRLSPPHRSTESNYSLLTSVKLCRNLCLRLPNLIEETSSPCPTMRFSIALLRHFDLHTIEDSDSRSVIRIYDTHQKASQHRRHPLQQFLQSVLSTLRATRRTRHPTRTTDIAPRPP